MRDYDEQALKNELLPLIAVEKTHVKGLYPVAIGKVQQTHFFDMYMNSYDGWFIDVQYYDGLWEIWFVVDIRGGYSDDDWFLEKVR